MIFTKYSGAENKFLIALDDNLELLTANVAQEICSNNSVDGALLVKALSERDFEWRFFNSDGSSAEMCGNAARCVAHFLLANGLLKDHVQLKTLAGPVKLQKRPGGLLQVAMPVPEPPRPIQLDLHSQAIHGSLIQAGVPHLVLAFPGADQLSKEDCHLLRYHVLLLPGGANITLVKKVSPTHALAKTYERGVENFTKACGTGAIAAAAYMHCLRPAPQMEIQMPGGTLFVEFASPQVLLSGPTEKVGEVIISLR